MIVGGAVNLQSIRYVILQMITALLVIRVLCNTLSNNRRDNLLF
jgi:hypothetical protein